MATKKSKVDSVNQTKMAAEYGFALAFMNSDPELKQLFHKAVQNTWAPDMFIARLRNTNWFKTHSASVRNGLMQKYADPETYKSNIDKMFSSVSDTWGRAYGAGNMDQKTMHKWAETAYMMGWSDNQLLDHMGSSVNYSKLLSSDALGGTAAQTAQQIRELTSNYGVDFGDNWTAAQLKRVMMGDDTADGVAQRVKAAAKSQYAAFADQIDAGKTMTEIADPYISKMADLLEMNPNDIGIKDSTVQKALTGYKDEKGRPMAQSLTDFTNAVRQDTRWQYTNNARTQVAEVGSQLLRSFGLMA